MIEEWYRQSPNSTDLTHWNSNIFSYIRLLRITYEVVKKFYLKVLVTTGGLDYDSF